MEGRLYGGPGGRALWQCLNANFHVTIGDSDALTDDVYATVDDTHVTVDDTHVTVDDTHVTVDDSFLTIYEVYTLKLYM